MIERCTADGPQSILKPLGQSDEALPAEDDMAVLKARPDQPEVIEKMVERLPGNRDVQSRHIGKIGHPEAAGFMGLAEDNVAFLAVNGPP